MAIINVATMSHVATSAQTHERGPASHELYDR